MKMSDKLSGLLGRIPGRCAGLPEALRKAILRRNAAGEGGGAEDEGRERTGDGRGEKTPPPSQLSGIRRTLEEPPRDRDGEMPTLLLLSPEQLLEGDGQPRRDFVDSSLIALADSIRKHGLLHPVTVRALPGKRGQYAVVAGERRLRAMEILGRRKVPCILAEVTPGEAAAMALVENLHRQKLDPFEEADAEAYLRECEQPPLSCAELGALLSVSGEAVKDKLSLRCFGERERQLLLAAELPEDALLSMTEAGNAEERISLLKAVCRKYAEEGSPASFVRGYLSARQAAAKIGGAKRKLILGDIRVFYNTVDKAVSAVRDAGIPAVCEKEEREDRYRITIEILKGKERAEPPEEAEAPADARRETLRETDGQTPVSGELLPDALRRRASRTVEIPSLR